MEIRFPVETCVYIIQSVFLKEPDSWFMSLLSSSQDQGGIQIYNTVQSNA